MLVSDLSEFELIAKLSQELGATYPPRKGATPRRGLFVDTGDDAAVTTRRDGSLIWTTDTMVAGVHFLPGVASWHDVGWKSLAVNLSDIAAMGGEPHLALVTLCLPPSFVFEDAVELYRGLNAVSQEYGVTIAGGDIVRAPVFSITIALSGWASLSSTGSPQVMTRSQARKGDAVVVTGTLGDAAGGLELLKGGQGKSAPDADVLTARHHRPQPRVSLARRAVQAGIRCAIDVSDGLVQDLGHIARASNAGITVDANRIPLSRELTAEFPGRALGLALTGGEDYELVLIAPPLVLDALLNRNSGVPVTVIGEVVTGEEAFVSVLDERGQEIPLGRSGWDHLAEA